MKTLFGMTAAVLLVVTMLFVSLPGTVIAKTYLVAENRTADEAVQAAIKLFSKENVDRTKQMIDKSVQDAKEFEKKAKTEEEKRLAKRTVEQTERIAKEFKAFEEKQKKLFGD